MRTLMLTGPLLLTGLLDRITWTPIRPKRGSTSTPAGRHGAASAGSRRTRLATDKRYFEVAARQP